MDTVTAFGVDDNSLIERTSTRVADEQQQETGQQATQQEDIEPMDDMMEIE